MKRNAFTPYNDPRDVPCLACGAKVGIGCNRLRKVDPVAWEDGPAFHRSRVDDVVALDFERSHGGAFR